MVWASACLFSLSLAAILPTLLSAQQTSLEDIFHDTAQAHPEYALGVAYALGQDAPTVMIAGPTTKGGSDKVANDAPWHIGSISKSFTSTLVMRLLERGEVTLDAPIGTYLARDEDSLHPDWRTVSLRQLLSHSAGMPANAPGHVTRETFAYAPHTGRRAVLSAMWGDPLPGKSGEFHYSNIGYVLAGFVVEEVTGESWEELIMSEIAAPLGLTSLGFGAPTQSDAARGHQSVLGFRRSVQPESPASDNPRWLGPAGTIHLNMADLVKWGQMHLRACAGYMPEYLSQTSCQAMQTRISSNYGLGWAIEDAGEKGPIVWHNGSNTMWYVVLVLNPERDLVVAVATNLHAPKRMDELARKLMLALAQGDK
ncbi:serine hydrolase domain-containing protein [Ruegeria jejuensis]|uniref:serine hydrolase domain-containing protein n=1 Tax=Ruegeria jejuensis TaxID=3233338 RepID=UPI00355B410F